MTLLNIFVRLQPFFHNTDTSHEVCRTLFAAVTVIRIDIKVLISLFGPLFTFSYTFK
jgi:hypothetical protein